MRKSLILTSVFLAVSLWGVLLNGCTPQNTTKMQAVTSTSLMEYIIKQVGGDRIEVVNLVPPNQHPGNFDVKPGDIQKLASADLFLLHGWPGEGYADKLIIAANNPGIKVVKANIDGNWMIPAVQQAATARVAQILSEIDPQNTMEYQRSAEAYKKTIQAKEDSLKTRLAGAQVSAIKVIVAIRQADFLQWAGFTVVASFTTPQAQTPQTIRELIDKGRAEEVKLVINNLQDGQDAGKTLAQEIGAKNLNLSNFPGGFENTGTWEKALDYNVDLLLKALAY